MNLRRWLETLVQDGKFALRLFRRSPVFVAAAVLTLALGIGANGAVFSILQSVLLQPLPYDDPERLVMLSRTMANAGRFHDPFVFSGPMVTSVRDAGGPLEDVAAGIVTHVGGQINQAQGDLLASTIDVSIDDRTVRFSGATVTPNFFQVLGVRAAIGRVFDDRDGNDAPGLVLSDATWRRAFGADPTIVGRSITAATDVPRVTRAFTVLGVLPRGVHFTYPDEVEAWRVMPWSAVAELDPHRVPFTVIGRVRPGLSLAQASAQLAAMRRRLAETSDAYEAQQRVDIVSMHAWIVGDVRPPLYLLGAVAMLLLLVTCVTVSNGLLARVTERQQELAVRAALGAGRSRVVQQLCIEGAILATSGTVVGVVLAVLIQPILRALLPGSMPQVGELDVNRSIVAFAAVMAAVTTILAAVAPAWGGTGRDAAGEVSRSTTTATAPRAAVRWRHSLLAAQAALTTILLVVSTLLLTSLWRLGRVPLGFDPHDVVAIDVQLLDARYRVAGAMSRLQQELVRDVRRLPGVAAVGLTSAVPFRGFDSPAQITVPATGQDEIVRVRYVDAGFFTALRVPIVHGRLLNEDDRAGSTPVTVISESFARSAFGDANPIGRLLPLDQPTEIVGVAGDMRYAGLDKASQAAVYLPRAQYERPLFTLVVRLSSSAVSGSVVDGVRKALRDLDPALPPTHVATLDRVIDATIAGRRFYSVAAGAFAVLALTITTIGLALVVARAVAERRRELAVRSVLGATLPELTRVAVGSALAAISAGALAGLVLAAFGSTLLTQFLFQITPHSPLTYLGAVSSVLLIGAAASVLPLRRLASMPLAQILRQ